jgi:dihydrofolate synthase / folylpolyglutamate synthase
LKDYKNTLQFLFGLQKFGMKLGLDNIEHLLQFLGNPEKKFSTIHIAGTNGKGSTAAMIASILAASGYKTGLYTSPHLIDFTERIRINGKPIDYSDVVKYVKNIKPETKIIKATFFEVTTAIAFQYFCDKKVDIAVIETGLGGRLDSTNVITPELSIITSIGLDHIEQLGKSISQIAQEKAGIIKPSVTCLTSVDGAQALRVIKSVAKTKHSKLVCVDKLVKIKMLETKINFMIVDLKIGKFRLENLMIGLGGSFQKDNIKLAVVAVKFLKEKSKFFKINKKSIIEGLSKVKKYSGIAGRMELLSSSPLIIGDVAHNHQAFKALYESCKELGHRGFVTVFGIMKDKDVGSCLYYLRKVSKIIIACSPRTKRALGSRAIASLLRKQGFPALNGKTVQKSVKIAIFSNRDSSQILVCGSHYVLGEAMQYLNKIHKIT